jgi:hypothetical protein
MKKKTALRLVKEELDRATKQHAAFNSPHEGYAVILEEVDELWAEVKANNGQGHRGTTEAVQTAAMAIRYLIDLCSEQAAADHDAKANPQPYNPRSSYIGGYSG